MAKARNQDRRDAKALIDQLVDEAVPVRRIWSMALRLGLWIGLGALMLAVVVVARPRADLAERLGEAWFLMDVGALLFAAGALAALGLAAAVPGREPSRKRFGLAVALAAAVWLVPVAYPANTSIPLGTFMRLAVRCEWETLLLASVPFAGLFIAVRRGAPLAGCVAGTLIGAAAFLLAGANMRLVCGADDRLHLLMGHALPGVLGAAASAAVCALLLRRWRRE